MSRGSTNSAVELDGCYVAAADLRSGATPPNFYRFPPWVRSDSAPPVSPDRSRRPGIPRNREFAKRGMGFAVVLDRRDSRPPCAPVYEETQE